MGERIHCIDAIYKNDDGSFDCIWLRPFGDDELSIRRGCDYCYMMLEWKTKMAEEGWSNKKRVAHGEHPDWPGEWVCIGEIVDSAGTVMGYEAQWKLYKTLHEAEEAGWKLIYSYFKDGKEIYRKEEERLAKKAEDSKTAKDRELLTQLIGKEIRTHYNTGGIVTNISGPHDRYGPDSWTINYTKDGKKSKNPFIINSIKVENGVITCEGKPLQIIERYEPESCTNWRENNEPGNYVYRGLV